MTEDKTLHIRLGKTYNAAPSKNALCGIAVSEEAGGWPDQNVGVVTCDSDGPWSFDKLLARKSYLTYDMTYTKNWCEDCLKQGGIAIPLLALKGGGHE
tara:strand:- start:532 stop:825 length:294 start_codon:yes stop_codon:yes gene_type:complete